MKRALLATLMCVLAVGHGLMQTRTTAADGPWAGWVQCQLTAQLNEPGRTYLNQQTHTWTLTAATATSGTDIKEYPAAWTVAGGGTGQREDGNGRTVTDKWSTAGQPKPTTVSFRVDLTGTLYIGLRGAQLSSAGATTGTSVAHSIKGNASDQTTPIGLTVEEFRFPVIQGDGRNTNIVGSSPSTPTGSIAPGQPPRTVSSATCSWNFVRGGGTPPPPPLPGSITRDQTRPSGSLAGVNLPGATAAAGPSPTTVTATPVPLATATAGPSPTTTTAIPASMATATAGPSPTTTPESASRTQPLAPPVEVAPPSITGVTPGTGQPGDAVVLTGSGFGPTPGAVHFIVNPGKDVLAQVDQWTDGMIKVRVPGTRCALPSPASVYVVAHGASSPAQPFQFTPTLATRTYLLNLFTPASISYPGALLPSEQLSDKWKAGDTWISNIPFGSPAGVRHKNTDPLIGYKGIDTFLAGVILSNAWVIDDVKFSLFRAVVSRNADASVESFAKGTSVPVVRVRWWTDLLNPFTMSAGDVSYTLAVVLKGPADMPDGLVGSTACR